MLLFRRPMPDPTSLADAEDLRQQITLDVQDIQAQLGDRQRTGPDGVRLSGQEYWEWKRRATHALNEKLGELRAIKAWIAKTWTRPERSDSSTALVLDHLEDLYVILRGLQTEDVDYDPDELTKIEAARRILGRLGTPKQRELYAQDQNDHATATVDHSG